MSRLARVLAILLLAVAGTRCRDARLPAVQIPQLREASEMSEYGGERIRAGNACQQSSETTDAYLACMQASGWRFVERGNVYPAPECWQVRDAGDPRRLPPSYCFHRASP